MRRFETVQEGKNKAKKRVMFKTLNIYLIMFTFIFLFVAGAAF